MLFSNIKEEEFEFVREFERKGVYRQSINPLIIDKIHSVLRTFSELGGFF